MANYLIVHITSSEYSSSSKELYRDKSKEEEEKVKVKN